MKDLILSFSIFVPIVFFSISSILGRTTENTSVYHLFAIISACLSVLVLLLDLFILSKRRIRLSSILICGLLVVIFCIGIISGNSSNNYFQQFVVLGVPAALVGIHYGSFPKIDGIVKWLDIYFIIFSISIFVSFPRYFSARMIGDVFYSQQMSYDAAFTLLLDLFLITDTNRKRHFNFTNKLFYSFYCYLSILFFIFSIIMSGGRGGFITLAVGLLVFLFTYQGSKRRLFRNIVVLIIPLILVTPIILNKFGSGIIDFATSSLNRIFSYVSDGKLDLSQTSGRDEILEKAFSLINEKPILGYGFFSYVKYLGTYPHNIFVEWLLQGGIVFFSLACCFALFFLFRAVIIVKKYKEYIVLLPLFVFPMTELLFSGTWETNPYLWFCLCFILNFQKRRYPDKS